jgi:hypothetical protein
MATTPPNTYFYKFAVKSLAEEDPNGGEYASTLARSLDYGIDAVLAVSSQY